MSKAIVKPGQTLADMAIQYCGSLSALPSLATLNGLSVTGALTPGQSLLLPDPVDKRVVAVFESGGYCPAVGQLVPYGEGIGWWFIENDFIVS